MATTIDTNYDEQLQETVGADSTATFETGGNYAGSNPTENSGSESLYAAGGLNTARKSANAAVADDTEEDDDEEEDEDDDDLEDDEDDDDDVVDEDEDEDDEEDDDLDEDDEDEDDDDDDEDATLKMEPSESIRGRATEAAQAVARRRS